MDIPDKIFFKIGEVSQLAGVKAYVLRYWETEFSIVPQKSRAGQRLYRRRDVERILLIKRLLYTEKFTIAGARKCLARFGRDGIAGGFDLEQGIAEAEGKTEPQPLLDVSGLPSNASSEIGVMSPEGRPAAVASSLVSASQEERRQDELRWIASVKEEVCALQALILTIRNEKFSK